MRIYAHNWGDGLWFALALVQRTGKRTRLAWDSRLMLWAVTEAGPQ